MLPINRIVCFSASVLVAATIISLNVFQYHLFLDGADPVPVSRRFGFLFDVYQFSDGSIPGRILWIGVVYSSVLAASVGLVTGFIAWAFNRPDSSR